MAGAVPVGDNPRHHDDDEAIHDVLVGDLTLRLVAPGSAGSRHGEVLAKGPRLWSWTVRVPDLGQALAALQEAGVTVVGRRGDLAWTDGPATTLGVPMEWVA